MRNFGLVVCGLMAISNPLRSSAQQSDDSLPCTMVVGFSQTADWYLAPVFRNNDANVPAAGAIFENIVDGNHWQLMWSNGAGVNVYADPDSAAWKAPVISPCTSDSDAPARIVYMISGPFGEDVDAWSEHIRRALANFRSAIPSAQVFALQPVVGAPANAPGDECVTPDGMRVRASWQATPIIAAIESVAARFDDVLVGAVTRLNSCSHYVDVLGHISSSDNISGGADVAVATGLFYRDFDFTPR